MATITQRLAFLISANADQAIKAFDKTAIAAEKELGKAGKSIDEVGGQLTKFGAAGLAAAGVIGQQLFKAGQSASDLSESLNKSRVIFGDASKDIEKFANTAADQLGLSQRAALDAASTFATFGKAAGLSGTELTTFSKDLVTLSADLASFYNTSPEDAVLAIGAALRGESEPIRRYGVLLNDAVLKQELMAVTGEKVTGTLNPQQKVLAAQAAILKQTSDAQGDFARTSDGLANTQRRVTATIEDLKAEFGQAAMPVIKAGTDVVLSAASGFNKLNDVTGGAISTFATFATVGLGVVSSASLVAGQAIKLRDRFGEVDEATGKFTGKLTTLGNVAVGGAAIIGAAAAVYAVYNQKKQEAEERTRKFTEALGLEGEEQQKALGALAASDNKIKVYIDSLNLLGLTTADVTKETKGGKTAFDNIRQALEVFTARQGTGQVAADAFAKAIGYQGELTVNQVNQIKALVKEVDGITASNQKAKVAQDAVNIALGENATAVKLSDEELKTLSDTYKDFSEAISRNEDRVRQAQVDKLIEEQAKREAEQQERRAKAQKDFADKVDEAAGKLRTKLATALKTAEDNAAAANKAYSDYQKNISGSVSGIVDFGEAQATAEENTKNLADAKVKETGAQDALTQALADEAGAVNVVASARTKLAAAQSASIESLDEKGELKKALDDEAAAIAQVTLARQELADAQNLAEDDPSKTKKVETAESKLTTAIKKQGDATQDVVDIRDSLTEEKTRLIEQAEKDLTRALDEQVGATKAVADGRKDLAAATNEVLTAEKQPLTFADALAAQVTKAEGFKTDLQKVLNLGGDPALINQLTSAGVDAGSAIMKGILNSSDPKATVGNLVGTLTNVQTFANQIGTSAADTFYGQGVKLANDLLAGVTAGVAAIDVDKLIESKTPLKNIARAAAGFDQSFATFFGAAGLNIPFFADGGIVTKPTLGVVGEAGPEAIIPLNSRSINQQPTVVNVTINVSGGDPNAVVDALKKYVRANGTLPSVIKLAA